MKWPGFLSYWPRDHGPETPREESIRETATDDAAIKVAAALSKADRALEVALRKANRKIQYLFFVIVVFMVLFGTPLTQTIENSYGNCTRFNSALDYFNKNAQTAPTLTASQKADRERRYQDLKGHCRGIWPFQP